MVARALFAAWSGDPAVVVSSPPGAGKTRLVTHLARELTQRAGLDVAVAGQTRAQALDVTNRAAATGAPTVLLGRTKSQRPRGLAPDADYAPGARALSGRGKVTVATTARWQWTNGTRNLVDVLLVDESWQLTWADLGGLGTLARQVVLVGDPGQIAPVVTADTRRWRANPTGPHRPAPDALTAAHPDAITTLRLPHTWRLGPDTVALIQPAFYPDLPFTSQRPQATVTLDGTALPEIATRWVDTTPSRCDPHLLDATRDRVHQLLTRATVHTPDGTRPLDGADVGVIAPHIDQAAAVTARLADHPDVFVGTINQAQGLERAAVVLLHPLAGTREVSPFDADPSRLCVGLSRHRAHLTVVADTALPNVLDHVCVTDPDDDTTRLHAQVLRQLSTA